MGSGPDMRGQSATLGSITIFIEIKFTLIELNNEINKIGLIQIHNYLLITIFIEFKFTLITLIIFN